MLPDNLSGLDALERLRHDAVGLALVLDEYGSFEGVVSESDLLEAIVGELGPEASASAPGDILKRADGSLLLDGSMPDIDGFDASRAIRAAEVETGRRRTPIVALTAHVYGTAADAWKDAGMDGILHKPFTLAKLTEQIERHAVSVASGEMTGDAPVAETLSSGEAVDARVLDDLLQMSGGAMAVVDRVLGIYRLQSGKVLGEMTEAAAAADQSKVAQTAHALKSMSFNVGARRLAELAGEIERMIRVDGQTCQSPQLDAIAETHRQTLDGLEGWRKSLAA